MFTIFLQYKQTRKSIKKNPKKYFPATQTRPKRQPSFIVAINRGNDKSLILSL